MTPAEQMLRLLKRVMRPLETRVRNMVVRIVVDAVNDGKKFQSLKVQGVADETDDDVEHLQPGGLSHVAGKGAEGVALRIGGRGGNTVVLCVSSRAGRPKGLQEGETALYTVGLLGGIKVLCTIDGDVLLGSDEAEDLVALAPLVNDELARISGDLSRLVAATSTAIGGVPVAGTGLKATFDAAVVTTPATAVPSAEGDVSATKVKAI